MSAKWDCNRFIVEELEKQRQFALRTCGNAARNHRADALRKV